MTAKWPTTEAAMEEKLTSPVSVDYSKGWITLPVGTRIFYADPVGGNTFFGANALVPSDIATNWTTHRDRIIPTGLWSAKGDRFYSTNYVSRFIANPSQLIVSRAGPDPPAYMAIARNATVGQTSLVVSNVFRAYDPVPGVWGSIYLESQYNNADQNTTSVRYYARHGVRATYTGGTLAVGSTSFSLDSIPRAGMRTKLNNRTSLNRDIIFTAVASGANTLDGNQVSIEYRNPGTNNAALSVVVTGNDIVVNLATGSSGAITSTAAQILTAIQGSGPASALVTGVLAGGVGTGVVVAMPKTYLFTFQPATVGSPQPATFFQGSQQPNKLGGTSQPQQNEITYTGLAWNSGTSKWDFTGVAWHYGPSTGITATAMLHQGRLDQIPTSGYGSISAAVIAVRGVNRHLPSGGDKMPNSTGDNSAYGGYEGLTGYQAPGTAIWHQPGLPWWNAWRDRDTYGDLGCYPAGRMDTNSFDWGFNVVEIPMQLGFDPPLNAMFALGASWRVSLSSKGTYNLLDRATLEDDGLLRLYTNGIITTMAEVTQPTAVVRAWTAGDPGTGLVPAASGNLPQDYPANTRAYRISAVDVNGQQTTASGYATAGRQSNAKSTEMIFDCTLLPRITANPSSIDLSWQPVHGAVSYRIFVGTFTNAANAAAKTAAGSTSITLDDATGFPTGGGSVVVPIQPLATTIFTFTYTSRSGNTLSGIPASGTGSISLDIESGTTLFGPSATQGYYQVTPQNENVGTQTFTDGGQAFTSTTVGAVGGGGSMKDLVLRSFLGGERIILGYKNADPTLGGVTMRYSGNGTTHEATMDGKLTVENLVVTGTFAASGLALENSVVLLNSNITLTTANLYTDILSTAAPLAAGTWLLIATVQAGDSSIQAQIAARLTDGTTNYGSNEETIRISSGAVGQVVVHAIATLDTPTTVKLQAASTSTTSTIRATTSNNPAGNTSTRLMAVRLA